MANTLTLFTNIQSILKHINNISFDLRSLPRGHMSGNCVTNHSLSVPRLNILLCNVSEKLKAWQGLWLKPKVDETTLSIELWGRTATFQIRKILQGMFDVSVKIDCAVSTLSQRTRTTSKADSAWARLSGWSRKPNPPNMQLQSLEAGCECHDLIPLVEDLVNSADHIGSLAEMAFRVQSGSILGSLPLQADLESSMPVLASQRRQIKSLTEFCASNNAHLDVDLVLDYRIRAFRPNELQIAKPLLRACYHVGDRSMESIDYDIYAMPALTIWQPSESTFRLMAVGGQPSEGRKALSSAASFVILPPAAASNGVDTIVAEACHSNSQNLSAAENKRTFRTEFPLLERLGSICLRERLLVAHGIASHGLLLLGGVWGDCFGAMNLRRRLDTKAQTRWFLHVHDPTAGLPPFEKSLSSSLKSQILDIGLLLIGVALGRQVCFEGEDALCFASRILPAVERSMGTRYKLACMFCLGVQRVDMQPLTDKYGTDSDVVTRDGHNVLHLFHAHVCKRLEQQLQSLDLQV